ncbi:MAG: hypothetical protein GX446_05745 [Chthonomonadales bacterium]|nr:hypothetical protein [Chthonomonadales bacterium]
MHRSFVLVWLVAASLVSLQTGARAQFTPIAQPDAAYLAATTKLPTPLSFPASVLTDGAFSVTLSAPADTYRQAPGGGWATWASPPWVEPTPTDVFYSGVTSLTLSFSQQVGIFGFEAEPDPYGQYLMTARFYNGASLVGSISQYVEGNAGARLFAAQGDLFDRVVFESDVDFAIGNLRYGNGPDVVPEAGTLAGFGSMAGFGLLWLRRRFLT